MTAPEPQPVQRMVIPVERPKVPASRPGRSDRVAASRRPDRAVDVRTDTREALQVWAEDEEDHGYLKAGQF